MMESVLRTLIEKLVIVITSILYGVGTGYYIHLPYSVEFVNMDGWAHISVMHHTSSHTT